MARLTSEPKYLPSQKASVKSKLAKERQELRKTLYKLSDKPPRTEHEKIVFRILQDKAWFHTKRIRRILREMNEIKICKDCGKEFESYSDNETICIDCSWQRLENLKDRI